MGFSLSGMMRGLGQGMADVGKTASTLGMSQILEAERAKVQSLRDERLQTFTTSERVAGAAEKAVESGKDRAQKDRHKTETLAASERATAASYLKNTTDAKKQAGVALQTDPTNPVLIKNFNDADADNKDAISVMKSRLGAAGAKADAKAAPKAGAGGGADNLDKAVLAMTGGKPTPKVPETAVPGAPPAAFDPMAAIAKEMGTGPAADDYSSADEAEPPARTSLIGRLTAAAPGAARPTSKVWYAENRAKLIESGKYTSDQIAAMDKAFGIVQK